MSPFWSHASMETADSLIAVAGKSTNERTQYNLYLKAFRYAVFYNPNRARWCCNRAIEISERLNNDSLLAAANLRLGTYYNHTSDFDSSRHYVSIALAKFSSLKMLEGIAGAHTALGDAYYMGDHYEKAERNYRLAVSNYKKLPDSVNQRGLANAYLSLGDMSYMQDRYVQAVEYYSKSNKYYEAAGIKQGVANTYNCLADIYFHEGELDKAVAKYAEAIALFIEVEDFLGLSNCNKQLGSLHLKQKKYEEALAYFLKAKEGYTQIGSKNGVAGCHVSIGYLNIEKGNYVIAEERLLKALAVYSKTGNRPGRGNSYYGLGKLYTALNKPDLGIKYVDTLMSIAEKLDFVEFQRDASEQYANLYELKGDYKNALKYETKYRLLNDSMNNKANIQEVTEMQMQLEFDRKQKKQQLVTMQRELEFEALAARQKLIRNIFIGGFGVALLVVGLVYWNFLIKKRANYRLEEKNLIISRKNKEITESIDYAEHIQRAMLTADEMFQKSFEKYFVLFRPRDIIGGDYYWMYKMPSGKVIWTVADCTGHGVPGALMSMVGIAMLNQVVVENKEERSEIILEELRTRIVEALKQKGAGIMDPKDGMDMGLCVFNPDDMTVEFAGAQNPMYIVRKGELLEFKGARIPVGFSSRMDEAYTSEKIPVQPGDRVYLLSDGYADQFGGPRGKKFKYSALKELLVSASKVPFSQHGEVIEQAFDAWKRDYEQLDDLCVVAVSIPDRA